MSRANKTIGEFGFWICAILAVLFVCGGLRISCSPAPKVEMRGQ